MKKYSCPNLFVTLDSSRWIKLMTNSRKSSMTIIIISYFFYENNIPSCFSTSIPFWDDAFEAVADSESQCFMQKYSAWSRKKRRRGLQYPAKTTQACPQNYTRVKLSPEPSSHLTCLPSRIFCCPLFRHHQRFDENAQTSFINWMEMRSPVTTFSCCMN